MAPTNAAQKPRWFTRWPALMLGASLALFGLGASPGHAATLDGMLSFEGFHVGAFLSSDGSRAYCLEPGASSPDSPQLTAVRVAELPAYAYTVDDQWGWSGTVVTSAATGETLRRMNWVLAEHGATATQGQAVVVQIALWELRREPGNAAWIDGKQALLIRNGGQSYVTAGVELAQRARLEAKGPGNVTPGSGLALTNMGLTSTSDSMLPLQGRGEVSYPAGTTSLSIVGGAFANGATTVAVAGGGAGTLSWTAELHTAGWSKLQSVTVSGSWAMSEKYWPAAVVLHPPSRSAEQRLGAGVAPVSGIQTGEFSPVSLAIDSAFAPRIATQVPHRIVSGEDSTFSDVVTVSSRVGSAPWPARMGSTGATEYLPLHADGTLYGPFAQPQPEQEVAPQNAPIAAITTVLLDRGPGSYPIDLPVESAVSGYYYWVWEISEQKQRASVRESGLLEGGSLVADRFGVREEGQLVPTELRWVTQLKNRALQPGERALEDSVRVQLQNGLWLQNDAGEQISAKLRFTVYQSDKKPTRQAEVPADARELGHVFLDVSEQDTWIDAPPFEIADDERGWVSVRACVLEEDQAEETRGFIVDWCDDYGVPEETAELLEPKPEAPVKLAATGGNGPVVPAAAGIGVAGMGMLLLWGAGAARRRTRCH